VTDLNAFDAYMAAGGRGIMRAAILSLGMVVLTGLLYRLRIRLRL
jgi:hypothetical protein